MQLRRDTYCGEHCSGTFSPVLCIYSQSSSPLFALGKSLLAAHTPRFLPFWSSRYEHCAHNTLDSAGDAQHSLNSRCCVLSLLPMIQYLDMFEICLSSISGHIASSCCVFVLSLPPGCSVHCDRDTVSAGDASTASADTISIPPSCSCNCWHLQTYIKTPSGNTDVICVKQNVLLLNFRAFCNE